MPYPFNYFASIFNFRSSFANRKKLSWFQMIFTSFFLISITLLPVALQNAQLKTYPLTTIQGLTLYTRLQKDRLS